MQTVIIVIHLMVVLAMIGAVLLQRSEGGGLGSGSTGGSFLSSRGSANVLTRTTAFLAAGFFATSLVLSILAGMGRAPTSILGTGAPVSGPQVPGAPASGEGGSVLDSLRAPPGPPQAPQSK